MVKNRGYLALSLIGINNFNWLYEELVRKKLKKGYSKEAIADSLEMDSDTVETIISAITIAK